MLFMVLLVGPSPTSCPCGSEINFRPDLPIEPLPQFISYRRFYTVPKAEVVVVVVEVVGGEDEIAASHVSASRMRIVLSVVLMHADVQWASRLFICLHDHRTPKHNPTPKTAVTRLLGYLHGHPRRDALP